MSLDKVSYC